MRGLLRDRPRTWPWRAAIRAASFAACGAFAIASAAHPALAVTMAQDDDGFAGIRWGTSLADRPGLTKMHSTERTNEFEPTADIPRFGDATVESIRYVAIDQQFARVAIRYHGEANHRAMLQFLQSRFGALDHTPGQMMRGLNQQYYWRGSDTQINVTFDGRSQRGNVFIESLSLAPRFNEGISDTGY
jgi:hypothetical protein